MAGNRYYRATVQEVLESHEWLIKEYLVKLDGIARVMHFEMANIQIKKREADEFIRHFFAQVWEQVAETEERKASNRRHAKMFGEDEVVKRTIIPKIDHSRESGSVNGKVTTRKMTEEERERIFGSIKPYTDQNGIVRQPGVRQRMEEALHERRKHKKKS